MAPVKRPGVVHRKVGFQIEQAHEQLPVHRQPQSLELPQQAALGQRRPVQPQGTVTTYPGVVLVFAAPADAGALEFPAPVTQQGLAAQGAYQVGGKVIGRHLDAFNGRNGRVLSVVVYLNDQWRSEEGGRLRIWADPDAIHPATEVEPRAGTLVCFLSDQIPHEVLEARRQRVSVAGWFRCNNSTADRPDPPR